MRVCACVRVFSCCVLHGRAVILLVVAPAAKADDKRLARAGHDIETNIDEELSYFVSRYLDPKDTGRISWHAVERFLRWVLLRNTLQLQVSDVTRFDVAVCAGLVARSRSAMDPHYSRAALKSTFREYETAFVDGVTTAQIKEYLATR